MMISPEVLLAEGTALPLIVNSQAQSSQLCEWAADHRALIRGQLDLHGAILFRGFGTTLESFNDFAAVTSDRLETFLEESSPRSRVSGHVYTSTDYPNRYPIQMHCEYSYSSRWPLMLYFCCLKPPSKGGETPIADTRTVLKRISSQTVAEFRKRHVLYRRNYSPQGKVTWQQAFRTSDRSEVERYCIDHHIGVRWFSGDRLQTSQVECAILRHPRTGESVWFNHAFFFNVRALEPESLRNVLLEEEEDDLHTNTYFGDGTPLTPGVIEELRAAYNDSCVDIGWQRGDILLVDNMLIAHGRRAYEGPRRVVVAMADGYSRCQVSPDNPDPRDDECTGVSAL